MCCIVLVRRVLVLRCGSVGVVWYPYAGWGTGAIISLFNAQHVSNVSTSIFRSLRLICWVISWVVLLWYDECWCYGVVRLGWCGILMQAKFVIWLAVGWQPRTCYVERRGTSSVHHRHVANMMSKSYDHSFRHFHTSTPKVSAVVRFGRGSVSSSVFQFLT